MHVLEFNTHYNKMPPDYEHSRLLEIFIKVKEDFHRGFLEYDTRMWGGGYYELGAGSFIVLLLQTDSGKIWTTIRNWSVSKEIMYKGLRGTMVNCVIGDSK